MRGLVVGFGNVFQTDHLPTYRTHGVEISAVVDQSTEQLKLAQQLLPGCHIYSDIDEALAQERVDFCDISAPPYLHASTMMKCIQHHMAVICEKPLVVFRDDLLHVLQAAHQQTALVFPCHTWLYAPQIVQALDLIHAGEIGEPIRIEIEILRTHPALGTHTWKPNWRTDPSLSGGGILMDHGYHVFYLAQQLLQATPSAFQVDRYHCDPTTGIEDVITVSGEFAKNGKKQAFRASFSWVAESRSTVYQIEGTQGSIRIEDATMLVNTRKHAGTFAHQEGLTASSQHPVWFRALFQRFLEAHRTHVVFHDDLRTACYAMEAIWTSYQCMQHGRTIPIQTEGWSSYFERP